MSDDKELLDSIWESHVWPGRGRGGTKLLNMFKTASRIWVVETISNMHLVCSARHTDVSV